MYVSKGAEAIQRIARSDWLLKELRGATGCRKAMRSTYKRKLEHKKQEQIKIQMYRYIKG